MRNAPFLTLLAVLCAAPLNGQDVAATLKAAASQHGLGEPRADTPEPRASSDGRGWWQAFGGGTVALLNGDDAHVVAGAMLPVWEQQKGVDGALGFPRGEAVDCAGVEGSFQPFEHGLIVSSPVTGTAMIAGDAQEGVEGCAWASAPRPAKPQEQPVPQSGRPLDPAVTGRPNPPAGDAPVPPKVPGAAAQPVLPPPPSAPVPSSPVGKADAGGVRPATAALAPHPGPNVSRSPGTSRHPDVAVAGNDVYAVWIEEATGRSSVVLTHSGDGGSTFSPPMQLYAGARAGTPHVAAIAHRVYVVWSGAAAAAAPGEIYLANSDDRGLTFGEPRNLSASAADSRNPVLALTRAQGADRTYVAWEERENRVPEIMVAAGTAPP
jgi:hypothetical protein